MKTNDKMQTIESPNLKIYGNCLKFENYCVQLSNVDFFTTTNISPAPFPMYSLLLILLGVLIAALTEAILFAIILILAGGVWIYFWHKKKEDVKQLRRLTMVTASGNMLSIIFNNSKFLNDVITVLENIIRTPEYIQDVCFNIDASTFEVNGCTFKDAAAVVRNINEHQQKNYNGD